MERKPFPEVDSGSGGGTLALKYQPFRTIVQRGANMDAKQVIFWIYAVAHLVACGVVGYLYGAPWGILALAWPLLTELYLLVLGIMGSNWLFAIPALVYFALGPVGFIVGHMGARPSRTPRMGGPVVGGRLSPSR